MYTFPLPLDAVLLDLDIVIGNRHLKGAVVEKRAAETKYEDAVESGDAAVMLEELEPGMYTMNVGNLLPRENVTITFPLFPASQMDGRPLSTSRANDDRFKVRRLASFASRGTRIKPFRRE